MELQQTVDTFIEALLSDPDLQREWKQKFETSFQTGYLTYVNNPSIITARHSAEEIVVMSKKASDHFITTLTTNGNQEESNGPSQESDGQEESGSVDIKTPPKSSGSNAKSKAKSKKT